MAEPRMKEEGDRPRVPMEWMKADFEEYLDVVDLASTLAAEIEIDPSLLQLWRADCYRFDDGTTQGWTLKQAFDSTNGNALKVFAGFKLANSASIALSASAYPFALLQNVPKVDFYFESPDLIQNSTWQSASGYSLDLQVNMMSACYVLPKQGGFFVQMQLLTEDGSGKPHLYVEQWLNPQTNKQEWAFHDLSPYKPYHLSWTHDVQKTTKYKGLKVKRVRLRCTIPYIHSWECGVRGEWLIGNVCPEG